MEEILNSDQKKRYKVIRTKHYSIIQMMNMARNIALTYGRSVHLERQFTGDLNNLDKPMKLRFKIELGVYKSWSLKSWEALQNEYDRLMK